MSNEPGERRSGILFALSKFVSFIIVIIREKWIREEVKMHRRGVKEVEGTYYKTAPSK